MNKYNELKVKLTRFTSSFFLTIGCLPHSSTFVFIIHRRQESLMPSWRGGGRRMLLKIIGLCHTEGMGTVHDNVSRRMGDARMVFLMLTE